MKKKGSFLITGLAALVLSTTPIEQINAHTMHQYNVLQQDMVYLETDTPYFVKILWDVTHTELKNLSEEKSFEGKNVSGLYRDYVLPPYYFSDHSPTNKPQLRFLEDSIVRRVNKTEVRTPDGGQKPKFDSLLEGVNLTQEEFFMDYFHSAVHLDVLAFDHFRRSVADYLKTGGKLILKEKGLNGAIVNYISNHERSRLPHNLSIGRKFVLMWVLFDSFKEEYSSFVKPPSPAKQFPDSFILDRS